MAVGYEAVFKYEGDKLSLTCILPDGSQVTNPVNLKNINQIEELCQDFDWNKSEDLSKQIGKKIFNLLNGDSQTLLRALKSADDYGERLQVYVTPDGPGANLPFELLCHLDFLVPSRIHLIRRVSDFGCKRTPQSKNRPLKILFMACSPDEISPVLNFEKEEDTIYEVTKDLPVEIDIEDTGSLDGLKERLTQNEYDIIHLSGHADITDNGMPFFWMEDEEGLPIRGTPSDIWDALKLNPPRLLFLSGCRTGETPSHNAVGSFASKLVLEHISTVLGWGLPVYESSATFAAKQLYFELSRGENILSAVSSTRSELLKYHRTDWSLLRLFSDGTPMTVPLVEKGQKRQPKPRELQYKCLEGSQVKVLTEGFVGRRRQIQQGLKCLKKNKEKVGLLLHGTGGLGKSCLAGKFCERFKDHTLIIVHGVLNAVTFGVALKDGFIRARDEQGLKVLEEAKEMPDKIQILSSSSFQKRQYLILLDDFEKNLINIQDGEPEIFSEALPILKTLIKYLPYTNKMSQLIITTKYAFSLPLDGLDLIKERLESLCLTSFRGADEKKKVSELTQITNYPDTKIREQLIQAGRGNPRLMEALNILLKSAKALDITSLLSAVRDKQEEFVQDLILREILKSQSEEFQRFMRRSAVYRLPVLKDGIKLVSTGIKDWELHVHQAVRLSLMEQDTSRKTRILYWVTPLFSKGIFEEQKDEEKKTCHQSAVSYYQGVLSNVSDWTPIIVIEIIEHALNANMNEVAIEQGAILLPHLRKTLAYKEALSQGKYILSRISEVKRDEKLSKFLFELGWIYDDIGNARQAIEYYEQALSIDKEVYGDRHPAVARDLNNMGLAWHALGDSKKAIGYFEQALSIYKEVYGDRHPTVATDLSNLGSAWDTLGDSKKAIGYFEQALSIDKEVYGDRHPTVATDLNNLGSAWHALGDSKKAIGYYEQALSIDKEVYGDRHPTVARDLNNLGSAWDTLGDSKKAIGYFEQALSICKEVYGDRHPTVATDLNNLGSAWHALGDSKKAIGYYEQALSIDKEVYGDRHPAVARDLNNMGLAWHALGDSKKAIGYFEQALSIYKEVYGDRHPTVATDLSNLGSAWDTLGDSKKAIGYYEQALSIDKEVYGDRHPAVATDLSNLGSAWHALGDSKKAIGYFEQALSIYKEVYGDRHPTVATDLNNLGSAWHALGDSKKAIGYFEQALSIDKEVYGDRHPAVETDLSNLGSAWHALGDSKKAFGYFQKSYDIIKEFYGDEHPSTKTVKEWLNILKDKK